MNITAEAAAARNGDRNAFVRLIRFLERDLYRVASAILRRDEDCADAIQSTVLLAYEHIHKLKEPAFFKTWLIRILINECNRILRQRKKVVQITEKTASTRDPFTPELLDLKQAVKELEESLRIVVTLHYFEDLPVKEIADILSVPEGTVKSRLHRARNILQEKWSPRERGITHG